MRKQSYQNERHYIGQPTLTQEVPFREEQKSRAECQGGYSPLKEIKEQPNATQEI